MGVRLYVCPIDGAQQPTLTELRKACAEIEAVYAISIEWKTAAMVLFARFFSDLKKVVVW